MAGMTVTVGGKDLVALTETQLASFWGVSQKTVARMRARGQLPPNVYPMQIGAQRRFVVVTPTHADPSADTPPAA